MRSQHVTRHWTELSAYIDGQLPANKAARLEKRLSRDSALRAEYEDLLRMRKMLRGLPRRRVPRNFTLTPDMVRAPRRQRKGFLVPAPAHLFFLCRIDARAHLRRGVHGRDPQNELDDPGRPPPPWK